MSASHLRNRWAWPLPGPLANVAGSHSSHRGTLSTDGPKCCWWYNLETAILSTSKCFILYDAGPPKFCSISAVTLKSQPFWVSFLNGNGGILYINLTNVKIIYPRVRGRWRALCPQVWRYTLKLPWLKEHSLDRGRHRIRGGEARAKALGARAAGWGSGQQRVGSYSASLMALHQETNSHPCSAQQKDISQMGQSSMLHNYKCIGKTQKKFLLSWAREGPPGKPIKNYLTHERRSLAAGHDPERQAHW